MCLVLTAFIVSSDEELLKTLKKYSLAVTTLSMSSVIHFESKPPLECTVVAVSEQCQIHLPLKALMEAGKESTGFEKKEST